MEQTFGRRTLVLSLFLHLSVGILALWLGRILPPQVFSIPRIEIELIDASRLNDLIKPHQKEEDAKRIVQTQLVQKSEEAAPDAFLGQQTQKVEKQSYSTRKAGSRAKPQIAQAQPLARFASQIAPGVGPKPNPLSASAAQAVTAETGDAASPNLDEYIEGMTEGQVTALNTKEFKYFSYFQRIREQLDHAWTPLLRRRLARYFETGRSLASEMDHTTKLMVSLNSEGEIVRVQILDTSGTEDLDASAVEAFRKAGPFPNPPKGIMERDGTAKIRWEFIVRT